jgi:hypothetical protein
MAQAEIGDSTKATAIGGRRGGAGAGHSPGERLSRFPARFIGHWPELCASVLGLLLIPLAADHGGYYPPAWGWSALLLLWAASLGLILRTDLRLRVPEVALLAAITALLVWTVVSTLWTASPTRTVLEGQRLAVYLGAVAAVLVLVGTRSYRALLVSVWSAIALICAYALVTRLFPERLGFIDVIAGHRLAEPFGYWNALGIFAAMGVILAFGLVADGRGLLLPAAAAASLVVLVPTLYFTFSRGAWAGLACGLVAAIALDPRRLRAVSALLAVGPWPALAVWIGSRSEALTDQNPLLDAASRAGHQFALVVVGLAGGAALTGLAFAGLVPRMRAGRPIRVAYATTVLLVVGVLCAGVFARHGSPVELVQDAYRSFVAPAPVTGGNLNRRLFSFSSVPRAQQWTVAWEEYRAHPWLGSGAGTYELAWLRDRTSPTKVIDAHSLYLETLSELGPLGLLLVLVALGAPMTAAITARRRALAPAAFGAYVAYCLHAGVDWNWEMTAVTVTALLCGAALLVCARPPSGRTSMPGAGRAAALGVMVAVGAFSVVGFVANRAVAASANAAREADLARATGRASHASKRWDEAEAEARNAARWAPWSTDPWAALADAQLGRRNPAGAAASFRRAIAKEPGDWRLWYGLARATRGHVQRAALRRAARLNPLSPEVSGLRERLGSR